MAAGPWGLQDDARVLSADQPKLDNLVLHGKAGGGQ
jgi:hypothetical protein